MRLATRIARLMSTTRPVIDVDTASCEVVNKARRKLLRSRLHASHALRRVVREYRNAQITLMRTKFRCSKKDAISHSEDPDPYQKAYIFYCVKVTPRL